jgi:hypothetical protein
MSQPFFQDDADPTKKLNIDISGIAPGVTRTLTAPNQDLDLGIGGLSTVVPTAGDFVTILDATDSQLRKVDASNFLGSSTPSVLTLIDAATISWSVSSGLVAQVTLSGNRTFAAPTGLVAGQTMLLYVIQDATGGRTLTWNAAFKFPGGTPIQPTGTANAIDMFYMSTRDGTNVLVSSVVADLR